MQAVAEETSAWLAAPLAAYLESLKKNGLRIICSSDLVTDALKLLQEPAAPCSADALIDVVRRC